MNNLIIESVKNTKFSTLSEREKAIFLVGMETMIDWLKDDFTDEIDLLETSGKTYINAVKHTLSPQNLPIPNPH